MVNEILELNNLLSSIGLNKSESKTYMALLELGKASSGDILNKAKMNTGKIYNILNSLKDKGFVGEITENGIRKFIPSDPERIYEYIEKKSEEVKQNRIALNSLLPKILNKLSSKSKKAKIEVYMGFEGYKVASLKEIKRYSKGETLYVLGVLPPERYTKAVDNFFIQKVQPERLKSKIKIKKIFSEEARNYKPYIEKFSEVKYVPYTAPLTLNIIGDLTILEIFTDEIIMITIESEEISKSFIQQFEIMWGVTRK